MDVGLAAAIIGIIAAIKDRVPQLNGIWTVLAAIVIGGAAGYFHVFGATDMVTGIMTGLSAVGGHTLFSAAGASSSTPAPTA